MKFHTQDNTSPTFHEPYNPLHQLRHQTTTHPFVLQRLKIRAKRGCNVSVVSCDWSTSTAAVTYMACRCSSYVGKSTLITWPVTWCIIWVSRWHSNCLGRYLPSATFALAGPSYIFWAWRLRSCLWINIWKPILKCSNQVFKVIFCHTVTKDARND